MTSKLRTYFISVVAVSTLAVLVALLITPPDVSRRSATLALLLVVLAALTFVAPVKLAPRRQIILHPALQVVALLTLSPGAAAALIGLSVALGSAYLRRPRFSSLFNAAQTALAVLIAGDAYRLLTAVSLAGPDRTTRSALALIPAGLLLYLVKTLALAGAAAVQRRASPFGQWLAVQLPGLLPHAILVLIGAATATVVYEAPWLMLVAASPVVIMRSMLRTTLGFDAETVQAAEAVAEGIELRRPFLAGRSRQIAELGRSVARACALPEDACDCIYLAGRLHDVALASYPDTTMQNDEDDAEQQNFRRFHAGQSAAYVSRVLRLHSVAETLRLHHERYDGRGFPRGLAGAEIPLNARVLAAAEAWQELTSARAYRPALTPRQAAIVLRAGAGTLWDPHIVEVLRTLVLEPASVVDGAASGRSATIKEDARAAV